MDLSNPQPPARDLLLRILFLLLSTALGWLGYKQSESSEQISAATHQIQQLQKSQTINAGVLPGLPTPQGIKK